MVGLDDQTKDTSFVSKELQFVIWHEISKITQKKFFCSFRFKPKLQTVWALSTWYVANPVYDKIAIMECTDKQRLQSPV